MRFGYADRTERLARTDQILLAAVIILVLIGVVMVYSSSSIVAALRYDEPAFYLWRQLIKVGIGMLALWFGLRLDPTWWFRYSPYLYAIGIVALVVVMIPSLAGASIKNTNSWFRLGYFALQPSEIFKLLLIFGLSWLLARPHGQALWSRRTAIVLFSVWIPCALVAAQPDFGGAISTFAIALLMLVVAGESWGLLGLLIAPGVLGGALGVMLKPYALGRIQQFLAALSDPSQASYQVQQSMIALGTGGWNGVGLGESRQKMLYLPEPFTDFVFAVIGEERGLVGTALIATLYLVIFWRACRIALRVGEPSYAIASAGLAGMILVGGMINMCVVTSLIPTTGVALPFISYGGSNLVAQLFAVGVLLAIGQRMELSPLPEAPNASVRRASAWTLHPLLRWAR